MVRNGVTLVGIRRRCIVQRARVAPQFRVLRIRHEFLRRELLAASNPLGTLMRYSETNFQEF